MCGIFGLITKRKSEVSKVISYFSKLRHRGEDFIYIAYKEELNDKEEVIKAKNFNELIEKTQGLKAKFLIGMNYFSVFGEPIVFNDFVFNAEIYNLDYLKELINVKKLKNDGIILRELAKERKTNLIDGIFAYSLIENNKLILERDKIGINPLFFKVSDNYFIFASENKVVNGTALNPRFKLYFDFKKWRIKLKKEKNLFKLENPFFFYLKNKKFNKKELIETIERELINSILRQTNYLNKVGIYFSGGIDSLFISKILQENNKKFTCLISGTEDSKDLNLAIKVAEEFGFNYNVNIFDKEKVKEELNNIIYYMESTDLMKVGVAIPLYFSGKLNNARVVLSGIGSEELFGGYESHKNNIKLMTKLGLLKIWERDLYRDNVISFATNNELRVPFLNEALIWLSRKIPDNLKIRKPKKEELEKIKKIDNNFKGYCKKYILRLIAEKHIGIFAWRPKKAAQYGSKSEKIIEKLAKEKGLYKKQFLNSLKPEYEKIEEIINVY
ncbi:MAG: asparagine synthase-related protein [Nanoarchaeota archaeon]